MSEKSNHRDITISIMDDALLDALLTRDYRYMEIVPAEFPCYYIGSGLYRDYTPIRFVNLSDGERYVLAAIPEDRKALLVAPADDIRYIGNGFWGIPANGKISITDAEEWLADEKIPFIGTFDDARVLGRGWIVLSENGKKNAINPNFSRSSLFLREWADDITPTGEIIKVKNGGEISAYYKDGSFLASDVASVTAYDSMSFIKYGGRGDNIVVNDEGKVILKRVGSFTCFGKHVAIKCGRDTYEIFDINGQPVFPCKFEKVARLGMYRVGLMYHGLWYIFDNEFNRLSKYGFHKVDRYVDDFVNEGRQEGFLLVSRDGKYNYLTENGNILLPFWCDKAELFNYSKTADIERDGIKYIVYDCKNERNGSREIRTTRPNIRVREKRRNPDTPLPPLSLSYNVVYDLDKKSYKEGELLLRGITSRIKVSVKKHSVSEGVDAFTKYSAAEYGKMLHNIIETIEAEGTWVYSCKCCGARNMIGEETASKLVEKYTDIRKDFEGIYVKDEYPCRGNFGYMTLIDFVFADVNGGAILVEIKTNAEYPEEYLRIQMSIEKQFFITTNPHIKDVKTYCFWFPRGNLEVSEIREVSADMTEDEIREYLCEQQV